MDLMDEPGHRKPGFCSSSLPVLIYLGSYVFLIRLIRGSKSNQIEPASGAASAKAFAALTGDDEAMARGSKAMQAGHPFPELANLLVGEFEDGAAFGAVHVVMRGITVVMLIDRAIGQPQLT